MIALASSSVTISPRSICDSIIPARSNTEKAKPDKSPLNTSAYIGQSRITLKTTSTDTVEFLHWLYLPNQSVLCIFDGQVCCDCQVL